MKRPASENSSGVPLPESLQALGVALLSEWDALVFLYRHGASLATAAQVANLIGHDEAATGAALQRLEALGLIQRSRECVGSCLYRFSSPPDPFRHASLFELMSLVQDRAGRLLILKHLKSSPAEKTAAET